MKHTYIKNYHDAPQHHRPYHHHLLFWLKKILRLHPTPYTLYPFLFIFLLLFLFSTLYPILYPLHPNNIIKKSSYKTYLYENKNPNFNAYFGNRSQPKKQELLFQTKTNTGKTKDVSMEFLNAGFQPKLNDQTATPSSGLNSQLNDHPAVAKQTVKIDRLVNEFPLKPEIRKTVSSWQEEIASWQMEPVSPNLERATTSDISLSTDSNTGKNIVKQTQLSDGVDLLYSILPERGVKEEIIINNLEAFKSPGPDCSRDLAKPGSNVTIVDLIKANCSLPPNTFTFLMKLPLGTQVKRSIDGTVYFTDENNNYFAHLEKPWAADNAGVKITDLELSVSEYNNYNNYNDYNGYIVSLTLPLDWLLDPARVLPVVVDPTIVHDTVPKFQIGSHNRSEIIAATASAQIQTAYQELPVDNSTVGLWHMNSSDPQSQVVTDSSPNGNNGTRGAAATSGTDDPTWISTGQVGSNTYNGMSFDGSNDYINVGNIASLNPSQITAEAWVYWNGTANEQEILGKWGSGGISTTAYVLGVNSSGQLFSKIVNSTPTEVTVNDTVTFTSNSWVHVAVTYDGNRIRLYKNGVETVSGAQTGNINSVSAAFYIGGIAFSSLLPWNGSIDEVRISNIARTPEEIKIDASRRPYSTFTSDVMDLGSSVSTIDSIAWKQEGVKTGDGETPFGTSSLVAQWNFNETSNTTANNDAEGTSCGGTPANCDGTLTGFDSTASQDANVTSCWTANNRRWGAGALLFDGVDSYVSIPNNSYTNITTPPISGEAWINIRTFPGAGLDASIFSKGALGYYFMINEYGQISVYTYGTTPGTWFTSITRIPIGTWAHVAFTYDGTNIKLYINGILDNSAARTGSISGNTKVLAIGAVSADGGLEAGRRFNGNIDSVRLYSRALSASEILSNYQAGNVELQTRTASAIDSNGQLSSPEAWKPTANETAVDSMDGPYQYNTTDSGLVSYWPMDETANDSCSGGQDACDRKTTNHGTATGTTIVDGKFSKARSFNGSSDYVQTAVTNLGITNNWSFELWVNLNDVSSRDIFDVSEASTQNNRINFYADASSRPYIQFKDSSGNYVKAAYNTGTLSTGTWYHFVGTWDGSTMHLYKNGIDLSLTYDVNTSGSQTNTNRRFSIGYYSGSGVYLDGAVDEVRMYSSALSSTTALQHFQEGIDQFGFGSGRINTTTTTTQPLAEGTGSQKVILGAPTVDGNTVALWHMDETGGTGAYIKDSTANANHGTPTGTTVVDGFYGKARSFNGTSDYISSAVSNLNITNAWTVSAWVKPNTQGGTQGRPIVAIAPDTSGSGINYIGIALEDGLISIRNKDSSGTYIKLYEGTTSPKAGVWYHITGTWDGTNIKLYVNGIEDTPYTKYSDASGSQTNTNRQIISGRADVYYLNGIVDEIKVDNVTRTADEIAEAYRAGRDHRVSRTISSTDLSAKTKLPFYVASDRPGTFMEATIGESAYANYEPDANTVGLWHLEEQTGSGAYIKDSSSYGNNGTPTNTSLVQGKIGKARYLDGSGDYINTGSSTNIANSSFTVTAWAKRLASGANHIILGQGAYGTNTSLHIGLRSSNVFTCAFYSNDLDTVATYTDTDWHHWACSFDASSKSRKIYRDGAVVASDTASANYQGTGTMYIGSDGTTASSFNGNIDEVHISNTARTADEIRQAYEIGKRTHTITIDFTASLDSKNLITDTNDLSFAINSKLETLNSKLAVGDKIIVKENYDGTEYIAQGNVTKIQVGGDSANNNKVTVSSWDAGSTFPTAGYTANATVFKWQREFFDLTGSLSTQRDAITRITLRSTNGSEGRNIWLDDFRSGKYYGKGDGTTSCSVTGTESVESCSLSSIASTAQRYFQYRFITSGWDYAITPNIKSATLNWTETTPAITAVPTVAAGVNRIANASNVLSLNYKELDKDNSTVGLWHLNETSNGTCAGGKDACDSSGNANHGTRSGTTIDTSTQKLGAAARSFNGSSDYVSMGTTLLNNPTAGTVEMWIKPSANGAANGGQLWLNTTMLTKGNVYMALQQLSDNKIRVYYYDTGTVYRNIDSVSSVTVGEWSFITYSWDSSGSRIYINGVLDASSTLTWTNVHSGHLNTAPDIGRLGTASYYYSGTIDEVRISNRALSPEEIKADAQRYPYGVYTSDVKDFGSVPTNVGKVAWTQTGVQTGNGETPFDTTSLVAQWNFNESSGTVAPISAGSCGTACNGTLTTFASTSSQDQAAGTGWTAANKRWGAGALMFDGSNDYVSNNDSSLKNISSPFSFSSWINTSSTANYQGVISNFVDGTTKGASLFVHQTSGLPTFMIDSAGYGEIQGSNSVVDGKWHLLVASYDGTTAKLYVDGILVASGAKNYTAGNNLFVIGRVYADLSSQYFMGIIDSAMVYSRALSASEILSNYQAGMVEMQTRTGSDNSPDDDTNWEEWKPATSEAQLDSLDGPYQYNTTDSGLVSYWPMDETANDSCSGGQDACDRKTTNHGTATGTTIVDGKFGKGRYFDGSDDYVAAGTQTLGGSISVEMWVKPSAVASDWEGLINKNDTTNQRVFWIGQHSTDGIVRFGVYLNGETETALDTDSAIISNGSWYHIAATYDGHYQKIYSNGVLVKTSADLNTALPSGTSTYWIGRSTAAGTPYFTGAIDEIRIYNSALSAATIYQHATEGINRLGAGSGQVNTSTTTTQPLAEGAGSQKLTIGAPTVDGNTVALWHMDETGGSSAYIKDATANANNGTPTGTTVVDGFFGKARSLSSGSEYINIGNPSSLQITTLSFETWVKHTRTGYNDHILGYGTGGWAFYFTTANKLGFGKNGTGECVGTNTITDSNWHNLAVTYDGSTCKFYIDGVLDASPAYANPTFTFTTNMYVGNLPSGNGVNGSIDEVRISNIARTAEEIAEAYRAGRDHRVSRSLLSTNYSLLSKMPFYVASDRPGTFMEATIGESAYANYEPDANTVGLWHLEEQTGSGAYIKDSSSYGNNGTPAGVATYVQGKIGKGRYFDGAAGSKIEATVTGLPLTTASRTMQAWFNTSNTTARHRIIGGYGSAAAGKPIFVLSVNASHKLYTESGSGQDAISSSGTVNDGQWHFATLTYDGTTLKLYLDGQFVGSSVCTLATVSSNFGIGIAVWDTSLNFIGSLDEVRLDNTAKTADEIRQAYEVGRRSHPITIDFRAGFDTNAADYVSSISDNFFTIDETLYGSAQKANHLFAGDKIILKENVDGTEYLAQTNVTSVNASTGAIVTKPFWDTGSTFPTAGYTVNATIFKWQREFFDLTGTMKGTGLSSDKTNAVNETARITLRMTDGSQGSNFWLDDLRTAQNYSGCSPNNPSAQSNCLSSPMAYIQSTPARYLQYRFIASTTDGNVSPTFSGMTLYYSAGTKPNVPTLDLPTDTATSQSLTPVLKTTATDDQSNDLRYKIQLCEDLGMTLNCQIFDQTSPPQTGWTLQDADSSTAYASGTQAVYTIQTPLVMNTNYYWRSYAKDYAATNEWSDAHSPVHSFTTFNTTPPTAPTTPYCEGQTNPTNITDLTPEFSAIYSDPESEDGTYYEIEVNTASDFSGTSMWDTGKSSMANLTSGTRSTDVSYAGTTLTYNGATYYWRIRFWDSYDQTGAWSTTQQFGLATFISPSTCTFEINPTVTQVTVRWNDLNSIEDGYYIEANVDGAGFSSLTTEAANTTSYAYGSVAIGHTYQYRVRGTFGAEYTEWCTTVTGNVQIGNFKMEGLRLEGIKLD